MSEINQDIEGALQLLTSLLQNIFRFLTLKQKVLTMSAELDAKIAALQASVANDTAVEQSAITLLAGLKTQLDAAIAAAAAAGASPAELQSLTDLSSSIDSNATALAAAVTANTPNPGPVPPTP